MVSTNSGNTSNRAMNSAVKCLPLCKRGELYCSLIQCTSFYDFVEHCNLLVLLH